MNRRDFLARSAGAALAAGLPLRAAPVKSPFGVCIYSYGSKIAPKDTLAFLDHCHAMGAAGIQGPLTSLDSDFAERVRRRAGEYGMYYEGIVALPRQDDGEKFAQQLILAKAAGATLVRSACLSGRRYENFSDLASWRQFVENSHASIQRAIPILEQHKVALALENHKDWTVEEMLALLQKHQSEYFGLCMDFGNNISLLDDPSDFFKLAPHAISTHVKDIALEPYAGGFRMAEVPLGEGVLDVSAMVKALKPGVRCSLEMITRDPLEIPCLSDKYWITFPEAGALRLARALSLANQRPANALPLARVSQQSQEDLLRLSDDNVRRCLDFGRQHFA